MIFRGVRSGVWEDKPHEQYSVTYADGRTQTWPLYDDPIPLRLEDLQDVGDARYSCEWTENSSFLLSKGTARQLSHDAERPLPRLEYEIVDVKQPFLFELCLGDYLKLRDKEEELPEEYRRLYRQTDDVAWQADAVYQKHLGNEPLDIYLICWGARIVQIEFPQAPTAAQITSALQKLRA